MRFDGLIMAIVVGSIVGGAVVEIAIVIETVFGHAPPRTLKSPVELAGELMGGVVGRLRWRARNRPVVSDVHGSARFGTAKEARTTLGGGDGLIVGRTAQGRLMRYAGPLHLLTIAPTRLGKGVGAIIPNLLTADRSVICIDPKGENARIRARARARFGPVFVLDPFEASGCAAFNRLAGLDPDSLDLAEEAALIAEALVHDPPEQIGEAHWNEEAKALIGGVIMHVVCVASPARRTLAAVREALTLPLNRFDALLRAMQASVAAGGLVARAANRHLSKSEREAAGVLCTAQRHTHFLDSPRMGRVQGRSDFAFEDLKAGVVSVILVLAPDRLGTHVRWLRLMVVQAVRALARAPSTPWAMRKPVLLLLDEFAALGRLESVERAFGLMAGYGVQIWAILQDLHQLRAAYGQAAGTFLSNAGLVQVFNVADIDTATWACLRWVRRPKRSRPRGRASAIRLGNG
jgi:type IV secretion system protein VirD4